MILFLRGGRSGLPREEFSVLDKSGGDAQYLGLFLACAFVSSGMQERYPTACMALPLPSVSDTRSR